MSEKILAEFEKGQNMLRVQLRTFKGEQYFDAREFYSDEGVWKPTKKGICLHIEQLPDLLAAVQAADAELNRDEAA